MLQIPFIGILLLYYEVFCVKTKMYNGNMLHSVFFLVVIVKL